jgi:hypothetical protein
MNYQWLATMGPSNLFGGMRTTRSQIEVGRR